MNHISPAVAELGRLTRGIQWSGGGTRRYITLPYLSERQLRGPLTLRVPRAASHSPADLRCSERLHKNEKPEPGSVFVSDSVSNGVRPHQDRQTFNLPTATLIGQYHRVAGVAVWPLSHPAHCSPRPPLRRRLCRPGSASYINARDLPRAPRSTLPISTAILDSRSLGRYESVMAQLSAFYLLLACLLCAIPSAAADVNDITVQPLQDVPDWATDASLQLILTPSGDASPLQYAVIPLTSAMGLNESHTARGVR